MASRHLVFDFNGTLCDDNQARLHALNDSLAVLGVPPIDMARYRETYCVPVPAFYNRLAGRILTDYEWELVDGVFQERYPFYAQIKANVMMGAHEALGGWVSSGNTLSLLSLHTHEELLRDADRLGITKYFTLVEGRIGPTGGSKVTAMCGHVSRLGVPASEIVVIGDTEDDARAAAAAGVRAVLFSGGAQLRRTLERTSIKVADTLAEAIEYATDLLTQPLKLTGQR